MHWFDLLAVHRTLKSLLQHHNSKVSILQHSAFFMVQLSHPYMTSGKTIALTIWTFVGKVMSLLVSILFRFVTAFLPRSKHLLISCLQSLSAVISEPKKIKSVTVSTFSPSICHKQVFIKKFLRTLKSFRHYLVTGIMLINSGLIFSHIYCLTLQSPLGRL